jgi:hypothetical protein
MVRKLNNMGCLISFAELIFTFLNFYRICAFSQALGFKPYDLSLTGWKFPVLK